MADQTNNEGKLLVCPECGSTSKVYESDTPGWLECHACRAEWDGGKLTLYGEQVAKAERERIEAIIEALDPWSDGPDRLDTPEASGFDECKRRLLEAIR